MGAIFILRKSKHAIASSAEFLKNKTSEFVLKLLQQIAIKRVCVQNSKALPGLDLVNCSCGKFDRKLL